MSRDLSVGAGFGRFPGVLGINPFASGLPGEAGTPRIGVSMAGLVGEMLEGFRAVVRPNC